MPDEISRDPIEEPLVAQEAAVPPAAPAEPAPAAAPAEAAPVPAAAALAEEQVAAAPIVATPVLAAKVEEFQFLPNLGSGTLQPITVSANPEAQYGPTGTVSTFGAKTVAPPGRATRHVHHTPGTQASKTPPPLTSSRITRQVLATQDPALVLNQRATVDVLRELNTNQT